MEGPDLTWTRQQIVKTRRDIRAQYEIASTMRRTAARMSTDCEESLNLCNSRAEAALLRFSRSLTPFLEE